MQLRPILIATTLVAGVAAIPTPALADDNATTQLVVGYKNADALHHIDSFGAKRYAGVLDALSATRVRVPSKRSASLIAQLRNDPSVSYVEVDQRRKASDVTPNDPEYAAGRQPEINEVNFPAAWEVTTGSAVKVAVVDTGVTQVGDLSGAVLPGYDFVNGDADPSDDAGHGTMVASLIAARGNDGAGMAGACWQCQVLPVKVLDSNGDGWDTDVANGIVWAARQGAKVINLSLGGPGNSKVLSDAVAYANDAGALVVAAAGNENSNVRSYPAAYVDVVAVGATSSGNTRAWFSNYNYGTNTWVDVAAPGIVTAMGPDGKYYAQEPGTSFSAPIVSGIAGLVKTAHPSYTNWSLMNAVQRSATPIGSWVYYGKVDAARALTIGTDTTPPSSPGMTPAQGTRVHGTVTVTAGKLTDNWSGIRSVILYVDGVNKGWTKTAPYGVRWNSAGRNGPVLLSMRIYDKAGNIRVLGRWVIADNTAPAVRITKAPANKSKISGTVKVYYTGSDKYGISRYQLLVNGKAVQTHQTTKYPFTFVASKYPKTNIRVQVRAYDLAGNVRTTSTLVYHR
ncbi:S8 family serine peptidase [Actinoplanes sp. CA-142083]|uniref:S8 family serine peptidase n=1 Tax=Actinoplanes sp. CA-142083 TaxID=3239903 RepID=UPI003D943A22